MITFTLQPPKTAMYAVAALLMHALCAGLQLIPGDQRQDQADA